MKKYILSFFIGGFVCAIMFWAATSLKIKFEYNKNSDVLWNSSDPEKLQAAISELVKREEGVEQLMAVFSVTPDGKPASEESKLITLEAISKTPIYRYLFSSLGNGTLIGPHIIYNNGTNTRIRCLKSIDELLYSAIRGPLLDIVYTLNYEEDKEILDIKILLLSKYLYLNPEDIENMYSEGGIKKVQKHFREILEEVNPIFPI